MYELSRARSLVSSHATSPSKCINESFWCSGGTPQYGWRSRFTVATSLPPLIRISRAVASASCFRLKRIGGSPAGTTDPSAAGIPKPPRRREGDKSSGASDMRRRHSRPKVCATRRRSFKGVLRGVLGGGGGGRGFGVAAVAVHLYFKISIFHSSRRHLGHRPLPCCPHTTTHLIARAPAPSHDPLGEVVEPRRKRRMHVGAASLGGAGSAQYEEAWLLRALLLESACRGGVQRIPARRHATQQATIDEAGQSGLRGRALGWDHWRERAHVL